MEPYYQDNYRKLYHGDCRELLPQLPNDSIDLLATDPPYGISFMGKDWDKALPDKVIWAECLRVLKPGAFAFVMSIPRADCLSRMIISLEDAGFLVNFTPIFWAYASGFPKAQDIGKAVDKRLGTEKIVGKGRAGKTALGQSSNWHKTYNPHEFNITEPNSPQAKALDGSYGGFQPKPAVEVIIVCMKPLSEKTFVDQALKNRKGITWLDSCRIPYESEEDKEGAKIGFRDSGLSPEKGWHNHNMTRSPEMFNQSAGRFPANLLVSDDVLNTGEVTKSGKDAKRQQDGMFLEHKLGGKGSLQVYHPDSGSFSRYFDLDKWWAKTFPFLIVAKASKSEKNKGIGVAVPRTKHGSTPRENEAENKSPNYHPTVKPLKLMSYLITLGSREGDTVLDPFGGSGTTAVAASLLGRKCIMYEIVEKYCEMAANRCRQQVMEL